MTDSLPFTAVCEHGNPLDPKRPSFRRVTYVPPVGIDCHLRQVCPPNLTSCGADRQHSRGHTCRKTPSLMNRYHETNDHDDRQIRHDVTSNQRL